MLLLPSGSIEQYRYVTDASGEVYQHLEYMAFAETFVEEHNNTDWTPYLFNGKEFDEETGLYYFGASLKPDNSTSGKWGKLIFDKATGMGFGVSRDGLCNGFRELTK